MNNSSTYLLYYTASHRRAGAPAKVFRQKKKVLRNGNLVGKIFIFNDFGWDLIPLLFDIFSVKLAGSDEKRSETGKDPVPCWQIDIRSAS